MIVNPYKRIILTNDANNLPPEVFLLKVSCYYFFSSIEKQVL